MRGLSAAAQTSRSVRRAPGALERIEARYSGKAFAPHRHDTYAIGVTLGGVQSFDYRGAARHSLVGQIVVLHPDELHDGRAGTDEPFHYRTLYMEPARIQASLGGRSLPFVKDGVSSDPRLKQAILLFLRDYERPLDEFEAEDAFVNLATVLEAIAGNGVPFGTRNYGAAMQARAHLDAHLAAAVALEDLEVLTGCNRWQLSRDFRAAFGTSPYRYWLLRRLDKARAMLVRGGDIARVAAACGFADQGHFTRQFKQAFGVTPKAWLLAMGVGPAGRTIVQ